MSLTAAAFTSIVTLLLLTASHVGASDRCSATTEAHVRALARTASAAADCAGTVTPLPLGNYIINATEPNVLICNANTSGAISIEGSASSNATLVFFNTSFTSLTLKNPMNETVFNFSLVVVNCQFQFVAVELAFAATTNSSSISVVNSVGNYLNLVLGSADLFSINVTGTVLNNENWNGRTSFRVSSHGALSRTLIQLDRSVLNVSNVNLGHGMLLSPSFKEDSCIRVADTKATFAPNSRVANGMTVQSRVESTFIQLSNFSVTVEGDATRSQLNGVVFANMVHNTTIDMDTCVLSMPKNTSNSSSMLAIDDPSSSDNSMTVSRCTMFSPGSVAPIVRLLGVANTTLRIESSHFTASGAVLPSLFLFQGPNFSNFRVTIQGLVINSHEVAQLARLTSTTSDVRNVTFIIRDSSIDMRRSSTSSPVATVVALVVQNQTAKLDVESVALVVENSTVAIRTSTNDDEAIATLFLFAMAANSSTVGKVSALINNSTVTLTGKVARALIVSGTQLSTAIAACAFTCSASRVDITGATPFLLQLSDVSISDSFTLDLDSSTVSLTATQQAVMAVASRANSPGRGAFTTTVRGQSTLLVSSTSNRAVMQLLSSSPMISSRVSVLAGSTVTLQGGESAQVIAVVSLAISSAVLNVSGNSTMNVKSTGGGGAHAFYSSGAPAISVSFLCGDQSRAIFSSPPSFDRYHVISQSPPQTATLNESYGAVEVRVSGRSTVNVTGSFVALVSLVDVIETTVVDVSDQSVLAIISTIQTTTSPWAGIAVARPPTMAPRVVGALELYISSRSSVQCVSCGGLVSLESFVSTNGSVLVSVTGGSQVEVIALASGRTFPDKIGALATIRNVTVANRELIQISVVDSTVTFSGFITTDRYSTNQTTESPAPPPWNGSTSLVAVVRCAAPVSIRLRNSTVVGANGSYISALRVDGSSNVSLAATKLTFHANATNASSFVQVNTMAAILDPSSVAVTATIMDSNITLLTHEGSLLSPDIGGVIASPPAASLAFVRHYAPTGVTVSVAVSVVRSSVTSRTEGAASTTASLFEVHTLVSKSGGCIATFVLDSVTAAVTSGPNGGASIARIWGGSAAASLKPNPRVSLLLRNATVDVNGGSAHGAHGFASSGAALPGLNVTVSQTSQIRLHAVALLAQPTNISLFTLSDAAEGDMVLQFVEGSRAEFTNGANSDVIRLEQSSRYDGDFKRLRALLTGSFLRFVAPNSNAPRAALFSVINGRVMESTFTANQTTVFISAIAANAELALLRSFDAEVSSRTFQFDDLTVDSADVPVVCGDVHGIANHVDIDLRDIKMGGPSAANPYTSSVTLLRLRRSPLTGQPFAQDHSVSITVSRSQLWITSLTIFSEDQDAQLQYFNSPMIEIGGSTMIQQRQRPAQPANIPYATRRSPVSVAPQLTIGDVDFYSATERRVLTDFGSGFGRVNFSGCTRFNRAPVRRAMIRSLIPEAVFSAATCLETSRTSSGTGSGTVTVTSSMTMSLSRRQQRRIATATSSRQEVRNVTTTRELPALTVAPTSRPAVTCDSSVAGFVAGSAATLDRVNVAEADLGTAGGFNVTFALGNITSTIAASINFDVSLPARIRLLRGTEDGLPNANGIESFNGTSSARATLTGAATMSAAVHFVQLQGYTIYTSESIIVEVRTADLLRRHCAASAEPPTDWFQLGVVEVAAKERQTLESTRVATSVVSYMSVAAGASAASDQQLLAVASMMFCAGTAERKMLTNYRILAPLATSESFAGVVFGNLILVGGVTLLTGVAAVAHTLIKKEGIDSGMAFARFPSLPHKACIATFSGTSFAAFQLSVWTATSSGESALGATFAAFCILYPIAIVVLTYTRVTADYSGYRFDDWSDNALLITIFLPHGRWSPMLVRQRFSGWFTSQRRSERFWVTQPLWSSVVMTIASVFRPERYGCSVLFGTVAAANAVFAVTHFVFRPHRCLLANVLSGLGSALVAAFVALSGVALQHPSEGSVAALAAVAQAQTALSIIRVLYNLFIVAAEKLWLGDNLQHDLIFTWSAATLHSSHKRVNENNNGLSIPLVEVAAVVPVATEAADADDALDDILGSDHDSLGGLEDAPSNHPQQQQQQQRRRFGRDANLRKHDLHDQIRKGLTVQIAARPAAPPGARDPAPVQQVHNAVPLPPPPPPAAAKSNDPESLDDMLDAILS